MRLALRALQALALVLLALGLGVVSLAWNLVALVLYPALPREAGLALGRRTISRVYRGFWRACSAVSIAFSSRSTAVTSLAPARAAPTEKPPV